MPKLLFVHGAAADARLWDPVIAALPDACHAEAITLTYFGEAPWPDDGARFGPRLHAQDIARHADAMGGAVHVVCWSYSVHVGLQALIAAPELFASALFYEAALGQYLTDEAEIAAYGKDAGQFYGAVGAALAEHGAEAAARQLVGDGFAELAPERQAIYLRNARMMPLLMGGGEAPPKIGPEALARIETPVRVVMGTETRPAFSLPSRALSDALPHGSLETVAGAEHFLPETDPQGFAAIVAAWIAEQDDV